MNKDLHRQSKGFMMQLHKRPIVSGLIALFVIITFGVAIFFALKVMNVVDPVALKVGEREVTQSKFDTYVQLGKKQGLSRNQVQEVIVEYEKNRAMADKYNIAMPGEYVEYMSQATGAVSAANASANASIGMNTENAAQIDRMLKALDNEGVAEEQAKVAPDPQSEGDQKLAAYAQARGDDNALNRAIGYNTVFDLRLTQTVMNGYGVFVYEFSGAQLNTQDGATASVRQARATAENYRKKVIDKELGAAEALKEVVEYGAANARNDFSRAVFIVDEEVPYDDGSIANVRSHAYLLKQVKKQSRGISELIETDANSVFFMNVLFEQKKRDNLIAEVEEAKATTRVVIYDK